MGLDVGVVTFNYLERLTGPTYKFACHLAEHYWEADWGLAQGENVIAEYTLESLLGFAERYAKAAGLSVTDEAEIYGWIRRLPWRDGHIALHFSW